MTRALAPARIIPDLIDRSGAFERNKRLADRLTTARAELQVTQEGLRLLAEVIGRPRPRSGFGPRVVLNSEDTLERATVYVAQIIVAARKELVSTAVAESFYLLSEALAMGNSTSPAVVGAMNGRLRRAERVLKAIGLEIQEGVICRLTRIMDATRDERLAITIDSYLCDHTDQGNFNRLPLQSLDVSV